MSRKPTPDDLRRATTPSRATAAQIRDMPALLDTEQAASITGRSPLYIAKRCADGTYSAVKVGRDWRINKARFLQAVRLT